MAALMILREVFAPTHGEILFFRRMKECYANDYTLFYISPKWECDKNIHNSLTGEPESLGLPFLEWVF